jgi:hypothetical protein
MLSVSRQSSELSGKVRVSRIGGDEVGIVPEVVYTSDIVNVIHQGLHGNSASAGAAWPVSTVVKSEPNWKSGLYVVEFIEADGHVNLRVASIVVRSSQRQGDILVKISTNTTQAYNLWGGNSLYESSAFGEGATMVSFDRPTKPDFMEAQIFFLTWIDNLSKAKNLKVDYISDFDLHADPAILDGYKIFVSLGHDEYWSKEMFDAVEERIFIKGQNVMFLGANTAYWQVRYTDINQAPGGQFMGRQMLCYKAGRGLTDDPIIDRFATQKEALPWLATRFEVGQRRPETMLMGVAYQGWFSGGLPGDDYTVVDASLPFFAGTGIKVGDKLPGIVGYEWDNRDPDGDGMRRWSVEKSLNKQIPLESIQVLFNGHPVNNKGKPGLAEAVFWRSSAGAKVFSSGTIWWTWGLSKPGVATPEMKTLNQNLFEYMLN